MIGDVFWEYMAFPLLVFFAGLLALIIDAWMPLLLIGLFVVIVWFINQRRKLCSKLRLPR